MKTISKIAAIALVAVAVVGVNTASAATVAELQAMIADLTAKISALSGTPSTPAPASVTFTSNLTVGSKGAEVTALQNFLIGKGYNTLATGYFGPMTKAALAAYQTAKGITPAAGYFGPLTRAAVNGEAVMVPPTPTPGTTPSTGLSGGAGDITVTEKSSGTESEIIEGAKEEKVLGIEIDAEGSDVSITSVKVELENDGTGSQRLNKYVDEVQVMFNGKVVGSADASDFSETSDVYSKSIALTGVVIKDNEVGRLYVSVTALENIDSTDLTNASWQVATDQIRFEDATGAILTDTTGDGVNTGVISEVFTFTDLLTSGDVELKVSEGDTEVNDSHNVSVDDSSDTNGVKVLSFKLAAEGSDIALETLSFGIAGNGAGVTEIANDFRLMKGDTEVGTAILDLDCSGGTNDGFASTTDAAVCIIVENLDDDDVIIEADKNASFTLVADINDIGGAFDSGDDLSVTLNADVTLSSNGHVIAEDENGDTLTVSELSGSADSTTINFLSTGISVKTLSTSATVDAVQSDLATDDMGIFTVKFEVTAIEDDAFIELGSATRGLTESNTGANFVIQDAANTYAATSTGTIALAEITRVSGGSLSGEFVKIGAGQTATLQLQVTFDPAHTTTTSEGYRMYMYSVNSAASAVDATAQQILTPEVDYRTGAKTVGN